MPDRELLAVSLELAVPMAVRELQDLPWSQVEHIAHEAAETVASRGDIILYRSPKKRETAMAFAQLARGVAALSFAVGGVEAFGLRFANRHPDLTYPQEAPNA